ncbi:MAG TPA: sialate O-acetylesterase [Cyclobacteriaceae bacterium]|nr:sialate O-acetylesterase [Cyclobacteriaceae bacterium]
MKAILFVIHSFFICQASFGQVVNTFFPKEKIVVNKLPSRKNLWVFLMAGQSNMAGRGVVEPADTVPDPRILTINKNDEIVLAKEPLHYYEPERTGLDCGLSFARMLLKSLPGNVSILMVPAAIGGSSIQQWLGDSTWHEVRLLSNAKQKIAVAAKVGVFKGILWHQGESNSNKKQDIEQHVQRLTALTDTLRRLTGDHNLPFLIGELGSFSKNPEGFANINNQLLAYTKTDKNTALIKTGDLPHKGDQLHFNSQAQRMMGERFAEKFVGDFLKKRKR